MSFEKYLNQKAVFEKCNGVDAYGEACYEIPIEISVRKEANNKLVRDEKGDTVISNTTVFCFADVANQDKIDGQCVISVSDMRNKQGDLVGMEVYL